MRVEVYVDVLCPWCYIGKRRLTAALEHVTERDKVQIIWRSFELAPDEGRTPGLTAAEAMTGWWGDQAPTRIARIEALGAAEGLTINLHRARPVNTFDAHRLCHLAADRGRADQMMEQLLRAYHTDGLNVADPQVLQRLGGEAGLADAEVRAVLTGDDYAEDVRADRRRAAEHGVTGVPSLVINGGRPVSAIQLPTQLRQLLETDRPVRDAGQTSVVHRDDHLH
ncbi:Predicted dithiol-disulfide isomerase, DsbA family [Micromonospora viridifaciens]|uniref:Predicted dithiol-disulfide isomerase, DsbA family n=1 Tax=Micromonospora viridifaciens TaxID=1881 RepID=A0A1C4WHD1_MICVI|nr:DsbA family oxidoreductase [Micromonospora viridifaciens]SCE95617.1 Predicted dithiol-disulfide isomerase, DsbA family [Micromonospora viridifaciens]